MRHSFTDAAGRRFLAQAEADDHRAANPEAPRTGQRRLRKIIAAVAVMLVLAVAAHVAPKAWGQYQHDLQEFGQ